MRIQTLTGIAAVSAGWFFVNYVAAFHDHDWKIYAASFAMGIAGVCYGHVT